MSADRDGVTGPFNPLSKQNLAQSIARAIVEARPSPLPPVEAFPGTGLYVIYYLGAFDLYRPVAERNSAEELVAPVYVGKAVSAGGRGRLVDFDVPASRAPFLFRRLREHAESIEFATNLDLTDFRCKYLVLDEVFIPLGESLLIQHYRPLWNVAIKGFGLHDPGSGRTPRRSDWDTMHPGRESRWRTGLQPGRSIPDIEANARSVLSGS